MLPNAEQIEVLRAINATPEGLRAMKLAEHLGLKQVNCYLCGLLKRFAFVIPNETQWECVRCGRCCRNSKPLPLTSKDEGPWPLGYREDGSCSQLRGDNPPFECAIHEIGAAYPRTCTIFPFGTIRSSDNPLGWITIREFCLGKGKGRVIDEQQYLELQKMLQDEVR